MHLNFQKSLDVSFWYKNETHMTELTDQELLNAYSNGSEVAFGELMNRHAVMIKAYAIRMLRNAEQAEEVCSETFLRVAMKNGQWEDRGFRFKSYLYRIANNLCIDLLRRQKVARQSSRGGLELTLHQQLKPSPEAESILGERASLLERGLAELPEGHRRVVVLRAIHGLSAKETAEVVGCDPSQVDSKLSYAKKMLREKLAELSQSQRYGGRSNA